MCFFKGKNLMLSRFFSLTSRAAKMSLWQSEVRVSEVTRGAAALHQRTLAPGPSDGLTGDHTARF